MNLYINRRNFVKLSLTTLCGFGLYSLIDGCAQRQEVAKPRLRATGIEKLTSHPAIPTPQDQCYLGWHHDIGYRLSGTSDYWLKEKSAPREAQILSIYKNKIGALPAVHSIADNFLGGSYYPAGVLEAAAKMGVYPMMRYMPRMDWRRISKGDYDGHLQQFSKQVSKAAQPAFFIPFPAVGYYGSDHPWKDWDPEYFIPAWNHMHQIFEQQGANRYLVWGLHLASKTAGFRKKREYYRVPAEQVNWVGVSIWNQSFHRSEPFLDLLGDDYDELTTHYKSKPFAIWELGNRDRGTDWFYRYASKWFERTFEDIATLPRCRLVVFYDYRWLDLGVENQLFTKRNIAMIKSVGNQEYYLTGGRQGTK